MTLVDEIRLSKHQFLEWNADNQFFTEDDNDDYCEFPPELRVGIIQKIQDEKLNPEADFYNKEIANIIANEIFNLYNHVIVTNSDFVYLIDKIGNRFLCSSQYETYRIAKEIKCKKVHKS